ncbi:unnamed protein product [Trichogramma brassicae]|uniref:RNase H type-1 domain-containing protein n=1 Tax=Trichogramma brassicae TaxID=86971 RepID=A0A6H5IST2_9HYME|nr:unnamed protein product [Trichogramma brassicae]
MRARETESGAAADRQAHNRSRQMSSSTQHGQTREIFARQSSQFFEVNQRARVTNKVRSFCARGRRLEDKAYAEIRVFFEAPYRPKKIIVVKKAVFCFKRHFPRMSWPRDGRRSVFDVMRIILEYFSLNWWRLPKDFYRDVLLLTRFERILRDCRSHISYDATYVKAGVPPLTLLADERARIYQRRPEDVKEEERRETLGKWQNRGASKGRWTHHLIPNIAEWLERGHGEVNYYLTQLLSGHGYFKSHSQRYDNTLSALCPACPTTIEDAEHVFFHCLRFYEERERLSQVLQEVIEPENIVRLMLETASNWMVVASFAQSVVSRLRHKHSHTDSFDGPITLSEVAPLQELQQHRSSSQRRFCCKIYGSRKLTGTFNLLAGDWGLSSRWQRFRASLSDVEQIRVPRWFGGSEQSNYILHGFSDASKRAYAAAVYIVILGCISRLIMAKTKIAPAKLETLPRLELCGAELLVKLTKQILCNVESQPEQMHFWCDSKVVLDWLDGHPSHWQTSVANRVSYVNSSYPNAV